MERVEAKGGGGLRGEEEKRESGWYWILGERSAERGRIGAREGGKGKRERHRYWY